MSKRTEESAEQLALDALATLTGPGDTELVADSVRVGISANGRYWVEDGVDKVRGLRRREAVRAITTWLAR